MIVIDGMEHELGRIEVVPDTRDSEIEGRHKILFKDYGLKPFRLRAGTKVDIVWKMILIDYDEDNQIYLAYYESGNETPWKSVEGQEEIFIVEKSNYNRAYYADARHGDFPVILYS